MGIIIIFIFSLLIGLFYRKILKNVLNSISLYINIAIVIFLVICIITFPSESIKAAYDGLIIWFTLVLPSLFPFFIGIELLLNLGVMSFIGTLLEPIMRPIFNVPGEGSFALAMSFISGYPVGVKIISKLRQDGVVTTAEAQRLVSFCSTSGPLFIMGTVSMGMFHSSEIGILLAICHYAAAIIVGLFFSFYKKNTWTYRPRRNKGIIKKAFVNLHTDCKKSPPFGIILKEAVAESIDTISMIGGFIIIFSVLLNILESVGFINLISGILFIALKKLTIQPNLIKAFISGLFEITLGCKLVSSASNIKLIHQLAITAFILSWSGLSIHAQSISILSATDINPRLYILSKFLQAIISLVLIYILYPIYVNFFTLSVSTIQLSESITTYKLFYMLILSVGLLIIGLIILLSISLMVGIITTIINMLRN